MTEHGTARAEEHAIDSEYVSVCIMCGRRVSLDYEGGELVWMHGI